MQYQPKRLSAATPLAVGGTILDFWTWAYSDAMANTQRGIFAEYLVGSALGVVEGYRDAWGAHDLDFNGLRIEVKSSAYIQSWKQKKLSKPSFTIRKTITLPESGGTYEVSDPRRIADVYVFCLHTAADPAVADVFNVAQWTFIVVPTSLLEERFGSQQTVAIGPLRSAFGMREVDYSGLRSAVSTRTAPSSPLDGGDEEPTPPAI